MDDKYGVAVDYDEDEVLVDDTSDNYYDDTDFNTIDYSSEGSSPFSNAASLVRDTKNFINDYNDLKKEYADHFDNKDSKDLSDKLSNNHLDNTNPYGNNNATDLTNKAVDASDKSGDVANKASDVANNAGNVANNAGYVANKAGNVADAANKVGDAASKVGDAASTAGDAVNAASGGDVNPLNVASNVLKEGGKNEDLNLAERGAKEAASLAIDAAADGIPISELIKNNPRLNHAFNNLVRDSMKHPITNQIPMISSARMAKSLLENPDKYKDANGNVTPESVEDKQDESSLESPTITHSNEEKRNMLIPTIIIVCVVFIFICILIIGAIGYKDLLGLDFANGLSLDSKTQDGLTALINNDNSSSSSNSSGDVHTTSSSTNAGSSSSGNEVIDELNDIALGEVGNGGSKYYNFMGYSSRIEWCASFVSWLFDQVDGLDIYIKSSTVAGYIPENSISANLGVWLEDECYDSSTVPRTGDLILFDPFVGNYTLPWPQNGGNKYFSSHVGYVYMVDDDNVYTVEGNTGGGDGIVSKKQYSRNYCGLSSIQGINGYYRPNY